MCGIVGYTGSHEAQALLMDGLRRLEYRGYDSAGVAVQSAEEPVQVEKQLGKLAELRAALEARPLGGTAGIGHTRWATHGRPSQANAHPHTGGGERFAIVHNGIIENYRALRHELESAGVAFQSETDSEVLAHLIARAYQGDLARAVRQALKQAEGSYAVAAICADEPGVIAGARHGSPLVLGRAPHGFFLGSDVLAFIGETSEACYLNDGDSFRMDAAGCEILRADGTSVVPEFHTVTVSAEQAEKEGHPHFMLKEIHQQPDVIRHLLAAYVADEQDAIDFPDIRGLEDRLDGIQRVVFVACGTAWHAAMVGKYLLEQWSGLPVSVELASEFRYRHTVLDGSVLVVAVSQSGETADTLEAARKAAQAGAALLAIVNVPGSTLDREAHGAIRLLAGPEIGVASTKAYTAQIVAITLFALYMGRRRGALSAEQLAEWIRALDALPGQVERALSDKAQIEAVAAEPICRTASHAMFIGRGYNYPSALEGALKLKEISYIHVEGYAAGEMKHGPIALVTDHIPVVAIAVQDEGVYGKTRSNIEELRARGGVILAIGTEGDTSLKEIAQAFIGIPACPAELSPVLVAIPLQLFAYYVACMLGHDVDQPRNLAKSVTVE
ncbi:MAG: glutamine--fructose-6-phosphate transaminase (isomerizing) [Candidatus Hydrogenedens sp.]|nr:glutamine--fructose-6-phosphate transaminase (isomerizing) [Candidatus Hydrogenedens sp.]